MSMEVIEGPAQDASSGVLQNKKIAPLDSDKVEIDAPDMFHDSCDTTEETTESTGSIEWEDFDGSDFGWKIDSTSANKEKQKETVSSSVHHKNAASPHDSSSRRRRHLRRDSNNHECNNESKNEEEEPEEDTMEEEIRKSHKSRREYLRKLNAYSWWSRLSRPSKAVMMRRCGRGEMADIDLTPDDVELLPWLAGGLIVDVPQMMKWMAEATETSTQSMERSKLTKRIESSRRMRASVRRFSNDRQQSKAALDQSDMDFTSPRKVPRVPRKKININIQIRVSEEDVDDDASQSQSIALEDVFPDYSPSMDESRNWKRKEQEHNDPEDKQSDKSEKEQEEDSEHKKSEMKKSEHHDKKSKRRPLGSRRSEHHYHHEMTKIIEEKPSRHDDTDHSEKDEKPRPPHRSESHTERGSKAASEKDDHHRKERYESARKLNAYNWWARMGNPKKRDMMKRCGKGTMMEIDLTPDDVELLPWLVGGFSVDVPKMMKWMAETDTSPVPTAAAAGSKRNVTKKRRQRTTRTSNTTESKDRRSNSGQSDLGESRGRTKSPRRVSMGVSNHGSKSANTLENSTSSLGKDRKSNAGQSSTSGSRDYAKSPSREKKGTDRVSTRSNTANSLDNSMSSLCSTRTTTKKFDDSISSLGSYRSARNNNKLDGSMSSLASRSAKRFEDSMSSLGSSRGTRNSKLEGSMSSLSSCRSTATRKKLDGSMSSIGSATRASAATKKMENSTGSLHSPGGSLHSKSPLHRRRTGFQNGLSKSAHETTRKGADMVPSASSRGEPRRASDSVAVSSRLYGKKGGSGSGSSIRSSKEKNNNKSSTDKTNNDGHHVRFDESVKPNHHEEKKDFGKYNTSRRTSMSTAAT